MYSDETEEHNDLYRHLVLCYNPPPGYNPDTRGEMAGKISIVSILLIIYLYILYFAIRCIHFPRLYLQHRYGQIVVWGVIFVAVAFMLSQFPILEDPSSRLAPEFRAHLRKQIVWLLFGVVCGFGLSIELISELSKQIWVKKEIEMRKNKAELLLYKAQINPHFLFNTLNTIYGLVVTKSDKAESAFAQFSDILQYTYRHSVDETTDIQGEIEYLHHYINLQRLRLNHHTHIVFETDVDAPQFQIPPMLLITFVENAFKYGTSSSKDCTIFVSIQIKNNTLVFLAENDIMEYDKSRNASIGIENCRKRLELLYPQRFELKTSECGHTYKVELIIRP